MKTYSLAAGVALLALTACGSSEPEKPAKPPQKVEKVKSFSEKDPEGYKISVEGAMAEVPPSLRPSFQKLLVCTLNKNKAAGISRPLDSKFVRELTDQLKADPTSASACQA